MISLVAEAQSMGIQLILHQKLVVKVRLWRAYECLKCHLSMTLVNNPQRIMITLSSVIRPLDQYAHHTRTSD